MFMYMYAYYIHMCALGDLHGRAGAERAPHHEPRARGGGGVAQERQHGLRTSTLLENDVFLSVTISPPPSICIYNVLSYNSH